MAAAPAYAAGCGTGTGAAFEASVVDALYSAASSGNVDAAAACAADGEKLSAEASAALGVRLGNLVLTKSENDILQGMALFRTVMLVLSATRNASVALQFIATLGTDYPSRFLLKPKIEIKKTLVVENKTNSDPPIIVPLPSPH